jgi:hypothetical protein
MKIRKRENENKKANYMNKKLELLYFDYNNVNSNNNNNDNKKKIMQPK